MLQITQVKCTLRYIKSSCQENLVLIKLKNCSCWTALSVFFWRYCFVFKSSYFQINFCKEYSVQVKTDVKIGSHQTRIFCNFTKNRYCHGNISRLVLKLSQQQFAKHILVTTSVSSFPILLKLLVESESYENNMKII